MIIVPQLICYIIAIILIIIMLLVIYACIVISAYFSDIEYNDELKEKNKKWSGIK